MGTWAMFSCTTAAWLGYGIVAHQTSLLVVNLVTGPTTWSILARLSLAPQLRWRGIGAFVLAALSVVVMVMVPTQAVYVLAGVEVVAILPQLIETFLQRDLSGVSVNTWMATLVAQSLWGAYGIVAHQEAVCLGGFAGSALGGVVALRIWYVRRSGSTRTGATPT
jgi:uncharacterized protein with PQ loop repeat